jgi:anthranilate phosphoribosyltransferase
MMTIQSGDNSFADYIRILGKGKRGSRPLTQQQAYQAMLMIMNDQVEPVQLGAFLMLMRVKEETREELAGFVKAAKESIQTPASAVPVDLDWSSYAGKRRHLPWFILSCLLLAENGISVFMHGARGHTDERVYTQDALKSLGVESATSLDHAARQITQNRFSYLDLENFCPILHSIIELRPLLGLRSPVHTLARMLNPFNSAYSIQGIFHPGYQAMHQQAALLLNQPHMAVLKGEGGEIERNPDVPNLVKSVTNGVLSEEQWPALFARRHIKPERLEPTQLAALWRGEYLDEYAQAAVTGTTAIALKLLGKVNGQEEAETMAGNFWENRPKNKYPC